MKDYIVQRVVFKGENESHSTEYRDTFNEAKQRMLSIAAADANDASTTYALAMILNREGQSYKCEIYDVRDVREQFYILVRYFEKNGKMSHSTQYYFYDPDHPRKYYLDAEQRWFNIIAADLLDPDVTFNGAVLINAYDGSIVESRAFGREEDE